MCNPTNKNMKSLRKFHLEDWSFEQKWVGVLLPLLLAFDNPVFAYTLFTSNPFPGAFDAIAQVRNNVFHLKPYFTLKIYSS
jgi:hypothetical protein